MNNDGLQNYIVYKKAITLYNNILRDTDNLMNDIRGREIARQLVRSTGSISATIEEGYGRGYKKEFIRYLRLSRGSARETKGWYIRSNQFLNGSTVVNRIKVIDEIIFILTSMITNLENKNLRNKP
jgi:four helix bundle protein